MTSEHINQELLQSGLTRFLSGSDLSDVREHLKVSGAEANEVETVMQYIKKLHYAKRRKRGMTTVLIGSLLLVFGCVFALAMHGDTASFRTALYGPCIIGAILVCWGMVDIMGF
ncbi:MAG: hypothetical protein RL007_2905 [Bacteroidota bacterium]|jgi:hypothetical protein